MRQTLPRACCCPPPFPNHQSVLIWQQRFPSCPRPFPFTRCPPSCSPQVLSLQHVGKTFHSRLPVLQARALTPNVAPRDPCHIPPGFSGQAASASSLDQGIRSSSSCSRLSTGGRNTSTSIWAPKECHSPANSFCAKAFLPAMACNSEAVPAPTLRSSLPITP